MKFKKLVSTVIATGLILASVLDPFGLAGAANVHAAGASDFNNISLAKGYKDIGNHNPVITQKFSADPCAMEYNGRVYVYCTNDGSITSNRPSTNTYGQINTLNVMSSDDMVNWTDHGTIQVAGPSGAARWATNSWAPTACHKKINGKEKFFLYFANSAGGIGVLTSDSPTGPWKDPIGRALITKSTPNCNVEWLFDPAVLVDTDGTGYLYFGGGVPTGKSANPRTIRVAKLGNDMTSISGTPVMIDAPWVFEDSGINKVGDTYYYSYCTNWNGGPMGNAKIAYMTSKNPMGPFTYQGTCLNNPGDFFQTAGNNHHSIVTFKNQSYIVYHAEWLNKQVWGSQLGYRTTHIDTISFSNGKISNARGTLKGVSQVAYVDPTKTNRAANMAWQGGINVYGLGDTTVAYNRGDWTGVAGVNFSSAVNKVTMRAASPNGATIRITSGSPNGTVIGYVNIPRTGSTNTYQTVSATINNTSGVKDIFFTASADVVLDTYYFGSGSGSQGGTTPTPTPQPSVNTGSTVKINDGWYYIKNTGSQKYLQVADNTGKANQNVEISTGTGAAGQKWKVTNTSDGYITLTSALGDFMLDVAGGKNEDGTNMIIYNAYSGDAQKYQAKSTSESNVVTLVTKASNGTKALDVYNFGTADGTNVCQWSFGGKNNQTWIFEPVNSQPSNPQPSQPTNPTQPTENGKLADGWYMIKGVASQKYLQVAGNEGKNVANVEISSKTGADGQIWKLTNTSNGYFTLTSKLGNFGVDIGNGSVDNGANVQIYASHAGDAQQFTLKATNQSGAYAIATKVTDGAKVLDVEQKKTTDGANVCQYTFNGQTNQMWIFEQVSVPEQTQPSNPSTQPEQPTNPTQPTDPQPEQPTTGSLNVEYTINNWGSGYQVSFKVVNKSGARVNTWTVTVPKSQIQIDASWNVDVKESGSNYVITPVSWNSTIENGNSVEFGIQGSGSIGSSISATVK